MNEQELTLVVKSPEHASNGLALNGVTAHVEVDDAKAKKKLKKLKKKEAKRQRALLERFPPNPVHLDGTQPEQLELAARDLRVSANHLIQDWLRPELRNLESNQLVAAQKSSAMIAINCLMLTISALAVLRVTDVRLWWAVVPLALTNLLSLVFAIRSAQIQPRTTFDELCAMPEEDYEPALTSILQDKKHLNSSMRRDLRLLGADLNRRQQYLGTAYNVLLGGLPLSSLMFGVCLALSTKA